MKGWLKIPEEPPMPRWWKFWLRKRARRRRRLWLRKLAFVGEVLNRYAPDWFEYKGNTYHMADKATTLRTLQRYLDGVFDNHFTSLLMRLRYGDKLAEQMNARAEIFNRIPEKK